MNTFRRASVLVGLATIAAALILYLAAGREAGRFFLAIDYRLQDSMFRIRGPQPHTGSVVIIDLDERSLAELGQWPWPRDMVADLLRKLDAAGTKVVGLDAVFAEPDRTSPTRYVSVFQPYLRAGAALPDTGFDHDVELGRAVGDTRTILGYFFDMEGAAPEKNAPPLPAFTIPAATVGDAAREIPAAKRAILNLDVVGDKALSEGFFNALPDASGMVRQMMLFVRCGSVLYPSLPLEMVREGEKLKPGLAVGSQGIVGLTLSGRLVHTDEAARLWLNYRGPPRTFPYISAADVIKGRVDPAVLRGRYALLGTSAWGLRDLRSSPFSNTHPGVEILATAVDNLLAGDPLRRDVLTERALTLTIIVAGGLLLTLLLATAGPVPGALGALALFVALVTGNYYGFFLHNQVVGLTYPVLTLAAVFMVVTLTNYFVEGRQKRFLRGAFSMYVSGDVVEQIVRRPENLRLEGEEKELTVLFSDIRDFTTLSERLTAREVTQFLNEYLTALTDAVMAHGGTVDKYIGDALMAVWGAPIDDPDHAGHAVAAALDMPRRLRELQPLWEARGLGRIQVGIGLNTGIMSLGNMGSRQRFNYTVIGDTVNQASRFESLNKVYGTAILVGESTRDQTAAAVFYRLVDKVRVKGKIQPVALYEPLAPMPPPAAVAEAARGFEAVMEFYSRGEFASCLERLQELHARDPQRLYEVYLERVRHLLVHPPGPGWDGVWTHAAK